MSVALVRRSEGFQGKLTIRNELSAHLVDNGCGPRSLPGRRVPSAASLSRAKSCARERKSGSQRTHRWSKPDSNS